MLTLAHFSEWAWLEHFDDIYPFRLAHSVAKGACSIYLAGNSYIVMERNLRGKVLTGKLNSNGDW